MTLKRWILFLGIIVGLLTILSQVRAQSKGVFIYGTVTTINGDRYEGPIRWGNDEVYWVDMFNAGKTSNDFLKFLSKSDIKNLPKSNDSWLGLDLDILSLWEDKFSKSKHQFDSRFGDIKSIQPTGSNTAKITLKNGVAMEVHGDGYEDVGEGLVKVFDQELGEVKLKWSRVASVNFKAGNPATAYTFGQPIYGKVNAGRKGTFTGIIQWDKDERFLNETLDGQDRNGKKKIPFQHIRSIKKGKDGSGVVLKSGRELYITGSNDVNSGNRGIIVNDPSIGQITIPWRDFQELEIHENFQGLQYGDFPVSTGLKGTVHTIDGEKHKGLMAFDLDEAWEFEILDGKDDHVIYKIPFRNIQNIIPKNYNYSIVNLKNGTSLLLGGQRDVSDSNDGILIFTTADQKPSYVKWSVIDEISFE